jgi:hypothetical protein
VTEPLPFKPEKPVEKGTDPGEKALKKLEKLEAETGLLGPADRYKALVNAVKATQDLIDLGDKKARFALVIMSVLNAVAVLLVVRGGDAFIPKVGGIAILIGLEFATYAVITIYYISQAISALRPRSIKTQAADVSNVIEPGKSMRVLFYADVLARDRAAYKQLWSSMRMDNLTSELADQLYTLSWISGQKYKALDRLYYGLTVMTVMLAALIGTIAFHRIGG